MTAIEKTQAIVDLLENGIPAAVPPVPPLSDKLASFVPALDDFDSYQNFSPTDDKARIIAVYIDEDEDNTDNEVFSVIIQAQIYGEDLVQQYHSVIMPFLRENLTNKIVGMMERIHIKGKVWPMDTNGSDFIFYLARFESDLDKCDF